MRASDIEIIYPPITKTLDELIQEFREIDKSEIYEAVKILKRVKILSERKN